MIVNIHAAKTNLPRLIERACAGEEIVIARDNQPVVKLTPVRKPLPRRQFGVLRGRLVVPDEFFDPLPDDRLEGWGQ